MCSSLRKQHDVIPRSVEGEQLEARLTGSHGRFRRMEAKRSFEGSEFPRHFGKFIAGLQDLVGPPHRSWKKTPDISGVVKGKRCAKEAVVVHDGRGEGS